MPTHDQVLALARSSAAKVSTASVAQAFVASLSSRRLDWRSALGSLAAVRHLPAHPFEPSKHFSGGSCSVCGMKEEVKFDLDYLQKLRREQHRLVRFYDPEYAAFDLSTQHELALEPPVQADIEALRGALSGIQALGSDARLSDLNPAIRGPYKSNKGQRRYILEAFAIAGILSPPNVPSYQSRWIGYDEREADLQARHFYAKDSAYPLRHWTGAAGVDRSAIEFWFAEYL